MKKIFLILVFPLFVLASDFNYELKIYNTIFSAIFPNKATIKVWSDCDERTKKILLRSLFRVSVVNNINNADILLLTKNNHINNPTMKFVTSYRLLKKYKNSTIGGFYWQKGRPNILFFKQNLQKYDIKLPASMKVYIENAF